MLQRGALGVALGVLRRTIAVFASVAHLAQVRGTWWACPTVATVVTAQYNAIRYFRSCGTCAPQEGPHNAMHARDHAHATVNHAQHMHTRTCRTHAHAHFTRTHFCRPRKAPLLTATTVDN